MLLANKLALLSLAANTLAVGVVVASLPNVTAPPTVLAVICPPPVTEVIVPAAGVVHTNVEPDGGTANT